MGKVSPTATPVRTARKRSTAPLCRRLDIGEAEARGLWEEMDRRFPGKGQRALASNMMMVLLRELGAEPELTDTMAQLRRGEIRSGTALARWFALREQRRHSGYERAVAAERAAMLEREAKLTSAATLPCPRCQAQSCREEVVRRPAGNAGGKCEDVRRRECLSCGYSGIEGR